MKVHVFPFSRRDGTPAASMPDQVPPETIKERVHILSDLERQLAEQFYLSRVHASSGEPGGLSPRVQFAGICAMAAPLLEVLAERESETRPGYVRGSDRWYMPVEVPGTMDDLGQFVTCRAVSANREGVVAARMTNDRIPMTSESRRAPGRRPRHGDAESGRSTGELTLLRSPEDDEPMDFVQLGIPQTANENSGAPAWPR